MDYSISHLTENDGFLCGACGKRHFGLLSDCIIGEGALEQLPAVLHKYNRESPFVLCDRETYAAAGERIMSVLGQAGIESSLHIIGRTHPAPDEKIVGEAVMFCPEQADSVIAVGGGVINDTGKILSGMKGVTDIYAATAPSMDGYASASSSMERAGLKVSLASKCPDVVIGDADVLAAAPVHMIRSGIGDMAAKYVSIAEWKIAALLVGDAYCDTVADMVNHSLAVVRSCAADAVKGDRSAVCRLTEALVVSGLAMNYAGISRPASGMEHYISHILDMRALQFGTPSDLHGIQCGIGTLVTLSAYETLRGYTPDREKALASVRDFDCEAWFEHLRTWLGSGAEPMIAGEKKEGKYDRQRHAQRLETILSEWDTVQSIIRTLPTAAELRAFFRSIGHPTTAEELGLTGNDIREAFLCAKDIRDKYVLGRLLWDLGILEESACRAAEAAEAAADEAKYEGR